METERAFTITAALLTLVPEELKNEIALGDEITVDVVVEWHSDGYATVESVCYGGVEMPDFRNEVEPDADEEGEAQMDFEAGRADYLYEIMKDRQMGL